MIRVIVLRGHLNKWVLISVYLLDNQGCLRDVNRRYFSSVLCGYKLNSH